MSNETMDAILQAILCVPLLLYYIIEAIILSCIPRSLRYKDVKGETVLITGAGGGLGQELAVRFSKLGCRIVAVDVNKTGLEETKKIIEEIPGEVFLYQCDVSKRQAIYDMAAKIKEEVGGVNILVNNAGIVTGKPFLQCPDEKILKTFEVNALAHFWTCKAFLPDMIANNHGHIVAIASLAGLGAGPRLADYSSSKFAAVGLEESIRVELAADKITGVKSTIVCPYLINTGLFDGFKTRVCAGLSTEYVASEIISSVLVNKEVVLIPGWFSIFFLLKWLLPCSAMTVLMKACGLQSSMDDFKGRKSD